MLVFARAHTVDAGGEASKAKHAVAGLRLFVVGVWGVLVAGRGRGGYQHSPFEDRVIMELGMTSDVSAMDSTAVLRQHTA